MVNPKRIKFKFFNNNIIINLILYEQRNFTILFMNEYMLKDNYVLDKKNL